MVPFAEALRFWLKLGFISFGGPAGQIAIMHRELVEERRWISEGRFLHALNYCMLLPGPEAQQLATYLGWLMHRTWGGIVAGALFVLPSLVILIALSALYVSYGQTPAMQAVLYGIKPAVVVLVLSAAWRLSKATLKTPLFIAIAALALVAIMLHAPFPAVIASAALVGFATQRWGPPAWVGGGTAVTAGSHHAKTSTVTADSSLQKPIILYYIDDHTPAPPHAYSSSAKTLGILAVGAGLVLASWLALRTAIGAGPLDEMARFFSQAALVTFGGAYAVLPYVTQAAVEKYQWLSTAQMMDGLALGETTPGPLIMIVAFVGYLGAVKHTALADPLLAGVAGACVATFFTFLPSFIFIFAGAPCIERTRAMPSLHAPLRAISAAVVGVMMSLLLYFGRHVFLPGGLQGGTDWAATAIALVALVLTFKTRLGVISMIAVCAVLGACYSFVMK
jgi:chromate transporter